MDLTVASADCEGLSIMGDIQSKDRGIKIVYGAHVFEGGHTVWIVLEDLDFILASSSTENEVRRWLVEFGTVGKATVWLDPGLPIQRVHKFSL